MKDELIAEKIKSRLKYKHKIEILDTVTSTMDYINSKISEDNEGYVVISNEQTKGRGRNGRYFLSKKNTGIYMTILIRPNCLIKDALSVTIFTSLAIHNALKSLYNIDVKLKWVNDIILDNLKIGGVLCESMLSPDNTRIEYMKVGIGLNIHETKFPKELINIATSLKNKRDTIVERNELIAEIINNFDRYLIEKEDYICYYKKVSHTIGKDIKVFHNNLEYFAKAIDITKEGYLIVEKEGKIIVLNSGEISIRNSI